MSNKREESKLFVHIVKRRDGDYELAGLSEHKQLWYVLPVEAQNLKDHTSVTGQVWIKSAVSAIKPINGFRKVGVKIDSDLKREYFDEDDNLCYNNYPLEESLFSLEKSGVCYNSMEKMFLI